MRIVIPGGSGQVGTLLSRHFLARGYTVTLLSHTSYADWANQIEGSDVCINLAGRSVNCRYTSENRRVIRESRVHSTRFLNEVIGALDHPPRLWMNASMATIYRQAHQSPHP